MSYSLSNVIQEICSRLNTPIDKVSRWVSNVTTLDGQAKEMFYNSIMFMLEGGAYNSEDIPGLFQDVEYTLDESNQVTIPGSSRLHRILNVYQSGDDNFNYSFDIERLSKIPQEDLNRVGFTQSGFVLTFYNSDLLNEQKVRIKFLQYPDRSAAITTDLLSSFSFSFIVNAIELAYLRLLSIKNNQVFDTAGFVNQRKRTIRKSQSNNSGIRITRL